MGVGQIRPVVKCRAPYRAVRGSPAARGKTKRGPPAAAGLRCAAADNSPRPPPAAGVSAELRARMKGKRRSVVNPQPGDSPVPRGEGMRPTTLPGRRRRTSRGTGNCPAPREVLPLLKKADGQASTLPGTRQEAEKTFTPFGNAFPSRMPPEKRAEPHGCRRKHAKDSPGGARGKTAIQIRKAPSPAALPARGKTRDPASAPKERTEGDCFSPGLRAMAETKSRSATRRNDGAIPRLPDGRAGFFLPIGSEWLTTGAWTPCEP